MEIMNCNLALMTKEPVIYLRISTWDDDDQVHLGFEVVRRSQRYGTRYGVNLDREEKRELLALEEECSG
jgi:hypothetical protein